MIVGGENVNGNLEDENSLMPLLNLQLSVKSINNIQKKNLRRLRHSVELPKKKVGGSHLFGNETSLFQENKRQQKNNRSMKENVSANIT